MEFRRAVESDLGDVIGLLNDDQFGQARNPQSPITLWAGWLARAS